MTTEIKKIYLKANEVSDKTGIPIPKINLIAGRLGISKYINGNYKFQEKHIKKIWDYAASMKRGGKRHIPKIKVQEQEFKRIKRRMESLGKYIKEELDNLNERLTTVVQIRDSD